MRAGPLLSESGPVDDVDVVITSEGSAIRLEAKCLLWGPRKSRFLINVRAHERSMRRQASGYLPVFARVAGSTAVVGSAIPMADVHGWMTEGFQYGDPALSLPLDDCADRYFRKSWPTVLGYLGDPGACGIDEPTLMHALPNAVASARAELLPALTSPTSSIANLCAEVERLVGPRLS